DGTADLYGPAPQAAFDEAHPADRAFSAPLKAQPAPEADVEAYLARETRFDSDLWIVETEDRAGRHLLDHVVRWRRAGRLSTKSHTGKNLRGAAFLRSALLVGR